MRPVAVIENSPALHPYFCRLLEGAGVGYSRIRAWTGSELPRDFGAYILTGDFHNITDGLKEYHKREMELLERVRGRRVFASCFSHQLVAMAHGGKVEHRKTRLLSWERVTLGQAHPATGGIEEFMAVCLNVDEVAVIPDDARRLGSSEGCENHVLAYGEEVLTCQGHPEMAVRSGSWLVNTMALTLSAGPREPYKRFRDSRPAPVPIENEFMDAVVRWLVEI